jgi:DNA-binding beta-propeller fold protein YncE
VVRAVSLATGTVGKPILQGRGAGQVAITPDGKTAYVANVIYSRVTPIFTATNTAGKPINVEGSRYTS